MKPIMLMALGLLFSGAVMAEECDNATTQMDMNQCAATDYQKADKELNLSYQQALKNAQPPQVSMLKKAQNAWISVRDSDCALVASATEGGSVQPMIQSQCLADKTRERTAWLNSLMQCDEGDLSCPLRPQ